MHSEDDKFFSDDDDFDDDPTFDDYGDVIEEFSDPEDFDDFPDEPPDDDPDGGALKQHVDHQGVLQKYLKMLKVGLPKEMVISKMKQDRVDPKLLDAAESDITQITEEKKSIPLPAPPPPRPGKDCFYNTFLPHFRTLSGIPPPRPPPVRNVVPPPPRPPPGNHPRPPPPAPPRPPLQQPNLDVDAGPKVPAAEHPVLTKFFKMLKVGLPKNFVERKMNEDNVDPKYIHVEPTDLVPVNLPPPSSQAGTSSNQPRTALLSALKKDPQANTPQSQQPKIRKKKLFLTGIDQKQLSEHSLWVEEDKEDDLNIELDKDEFNRLFVEDISSAANNAMKTIKPEQDDKIKKIKGITLINMKRAQNAGIALARIKLSYQDIKLKIKELDSTVFTIEQLESLKEFLPNQEEVLQIKNYKNDINLLGLAEKYMLTMIDFIPEAKIFINVIVYKLQFLSRWQDCKHKLSMIESACDHIKLSVRLKKVLKTILKIVNQLNDGEEHKAITVESLLKLSTAKAFDKKTSVLQYVIMLIARHNADPLLFPDDLKYLFEVSRLSLENIITEKTLLENELKLHIDSLRRIYNAHQQQLALNPEMASNPDSSQQLADKNLLDTLEQFEKQLVPLCEELNHRVTILTNKYQNILIYFGEDLKLTCQDFFLTLSKFVTDFITTRDQFERARQLEIKKQQRAAAAAAKAASKMNSNPGEQQPVIKVRRNSKLGRLIEQNKNNNVNNNQSGAESNSSPTIIQP